MNQERLLEVDGLTVTYGRGAGSVTAVDDVSLHLDRGEALGLVGESGCGKTTLANALIRLLPDSATTTARRIRLGDTDLLTEDDDAFRREMRWKRIAMVFQSAMNTLNPVETVGRQMSRVARLHARQEPATDQRRRLVGLLTTVGLAEAVASRYPHELSGGMRQRVGIAFSLIAQPELIIADEATTALDVVVQAQILAELASLKRTSGMGMIVVSHDMDVVATACDRIAVMYAGRIVETGVTTEVLGAPQHPYTAALLASLPRLTGPNHRLATLPGAPPADAGRMQGCRFAPRCPLVTDLCRRVEPPLAPAPSGDLARCHYAGDPRLATMWAVAS
jgi:oligopeptide/dipeptide ABC transporter ATP-binding protein